ncbi:MAG: pyridoxamine 5'-phosphate oxidase [Gammaproteobacteria bacterium]|nr:pyridoxamine 5'-phosphate oxidase [Gammaproteobacteria bacterium]
MANHDQHKTRRDYEGDALNRADLHADPFQQFSHWLQEVIDFGSKDATAMTLATADADGAPSARTVLLKQHDAAGFVWFTDSRSPKGRELAVNARAELLFYWRDLDRQVRIRGTVQMLPVEHAEQYFHSRPEGSRFSTAGSVQSSIVADRSELEARIEQLHVRYPDGNVPRPDAWVGYCLQPRYFEFWQGRVNRLHDRFCYALNDGGWLIDRLAP